MPHLVCEDQLHGELLGVPLSLIDIWMDGFDLVSHCHHHHHRDGQGHGENKRGRYHTKMQGQR